MNKEVSKALVKLLNALTEFVREGTAQIKEERERNAQ